MPILLLLAAIFLVLWRLPKVELGLTDAFKRRRFANWFPLGLTYAFLYFGRYNLSAIQPDLEKAGLLSKSQFGDIDAAGAIVYGLAFLLNGPLTDRWGGRVTILIAAAGSALMNLAAGLLFQRQAGGALQPGQLVSALTAINALNMYFQSFGAVSIVKVNAAWFHLRERGVLGGVFGILISLGLYFAYDWSLAIGRALPLQWVFFLPALVLVLLFAVDLLLIRDSPAAAGLPDLQTGDAEYGDGTAAPGLAQLARRMFAQRAIWLLVAVEFCSGFLRNAVMKWYRSYAKDTSATDTFVYANWGLVTCVAGILGGVLAGLISDHLFASRRGPVASVLYGGLAGGALVSLLLLGRPSLGWSVALMSLCVIGVHGMLSGTASADFGGKRGAGMTTGIIDGFVYLGTAAQSLVFGHLLPQGAAAHDAANWRPWPLVMLPVALLGLTLASRLWNARPQSAPGGH
jgi:OPA family glycerol-3-phosphate transporter-like MFS transporter